MTTQQTYCNQFTQLFEAFSEKVKDADTDTLLEKFRGSLSESIDDSIKELENQQTEFITAYQTTVKEFLDEWFRKYHDKSKRGWFATDVEFEENQRVVINRDLSITGEPLIWHFPQIIRKITGQFITNSRTCRIDDVDFLEEVGGLQIDNTTIRSMKRLKRVEEEVNIRYGSIRQLDALEWVGARFDAWETPGFKSAKKLTHIGGNALFKGTRGVNLDSLTTVGGELLLSDCQNPRVRFPQLQKTGKLIADAYLPNFSYSFPSLLKIGADQWGDSGIVPDSWIFQMNQAGVIVKGNLRTA